MPILSHDPNHVKIINLAYLRGGKGPYILRQEGYAPGSSTMKNGVFYLTEDGSWMLNYAFYLLPEEEQTKAFFGSLKEVLEAVDDLASQEVVAHSELPKGTTPESIRAAIRATGNRMVQKLQNAKASNFSS